MYNVHVHVNASIYEDKDHIIGISIKFLTL